MRSISRLSVTDDRDLYSGLIRLHVLHHASEEPIFGLGMVNELARHGYRSNEWVAHVRDLRGFDPRNDFELNLEYDL